MIYNTAERVETKINLTMYTIKYDSKLDRLQYIFHRKSHIYDKK